MKACGQTWLWSLRPTPRQCFFSCSQEQSRRISILWSVFPNCTDALFSITIVLSTLYLSVPQGRLPSCACTVISIQNGFIPDTGDCSQLLFWTGIWAHLHPTARHLKQFVPPSLLHNSTFGGSTSGQPSSQASDGEWKGTCSCQQNCSAPTNHLFLKLACLELFVPNVHLQYKFLGYIATVWKIYI